MMIDKNIISQETSLSGLKSGGKKICKVDYGIGSSYDDCIELNRKLFTDKYKSLKDKILAHELRHDNSFYSLNDILNDFHSNNSYFKEQFLFCLENPEGFINFFPFMYSFEQKAFTYNVSAIIPFFYFGIIWTLFWYFTTTFSLWGIIFYYIVYVLLLNIIAQAVAYRNYRIMNKKA